MTSFWLSALVVPVAALGFSRGVRAAWTASAAAAGLTVAAWAAGWSVCLPGCITVFAVLPWILGRLEKRFRTEGVRFAGEEEVKTQKARQLIEEETSCQTRILTQEEAIQEIGQLYDLSKKFLGTLDLDQGLQLTDDFIRRWFPDMPKSARESALQRIAALIENETVTAEGLARILPVHSGGIGWERWAIAAEQLALGLQRLSLYRTVQESATHDGLTGLLVRRYFLQRLRDEVDRAKRRSSRVTVLMIDLDRFKTVNDTYGHLVGDVVLREVSQQIRNSVREMDLVGRYGGEEFEVVLPEAGLDLGLQIAERIRRAIEGAVIHAYDEDVHITVSIGVAGFPQDAQTPAELIEKADEALYRAKESGRNKTVAWGKP